MTERSLQVTCRMGRTLAAYLHLSHPTGEKSARTVAAPDGLLIVDYAASGQPLGVEITAPQAVPLDEPPLAEQDYRPRGQRRWTTIPAMSRPCEPRLCGRQEQRHGTHWRELQLPAPSSVSPPAFTKSARAWR
jgi:hypothetical protein